MKIDKIMAIFFFVVCSLFCRLGFCDDDTQKVLRVAVLDNPNLPEKVWMWSHYEKAYLAGIEVAALEAKKKNITIEYQTFFYGEHPLDILKQIPAVMEWKPDLVLGPHYSNQFLLLKKYFPDTLVLSSYATDQAIYQLPDNFYSIFPPGDTLIKALSQFIHTRFPNKSVDMIIQADCKNCEDVAKSLSADLHQLDENTVSTKTEFIGDEIEEININEITNIHKTGNLIFLQPINYYLCINLMSRIADFLKEPDLVFFTALDSWGSLEVPDKISLKKLPIKYDAYRITLLLLDDNTDQKLTQFRGLFLNLYKKSPTDSVSYMTFLSAMSAVVAMEKFPVNDPEFSMREKVLASYRKALAFDSNWFRPRKYGIYHYTNDVNSKGEILVDIIPAFEPQGNH